MRKASDDIASLNKGKTISSPSTTTARQSPKRKAKKQKVEVKEVGLVEVERAVKYAGWRASSIVDSSPPVGEVHPLPLWGEENLKGAFRGRISLPTFQAFQDLYKLVDENTKNGVPWGEEVETDPRRRAYGFVNGGRTRIMEEGILIHPLPSSDFPSLEEKESLMRQHRQAMEESSVDLCLNNDNHENSVASILPITPAMIRALEEITDMIHGAMPDDTYKKFLTIEQLISVQTNSHGGSTYLPLHLDFPRHDGFGVVIVTIGISKGAINSWVVLKDDQKDVSVAWQMQPQEFYVLSGGARNTCRHGVWVEKRDERTTSDRKTLNLRYGLHSRDFAYQEIDRHWTA